MTQLYIRPELPAYGPQEPYSFFDNLLNWALLLFLLKVGGCLIPWWYAQWLLEQPWTDTAMRRALVQSLERFSIPHAWDSDIDRSGHCHDYWRKISTAFYLADRSPKTCRLAARYGLIPKLTYLILRQAGIRKRLSCWSTSVDPYYALMERIQKIAIS